MSNDKDHQVIAEVARQMLDDMTSKGKQVMRQNIRIVFGKSQIVTLKHSAVTTGNDQTSLYLDPIDLEVLTSALRSERPTDTKRPTLKLKSNGKASYPDE